jgi:hypothetical protein
VGAETDLDLTRWNVRWNDELQRLDVPLEAQLRKRRFAGDLQLAFNVA